LADEQCIVLLLKVSGSQQDFEFVPTFTLNFLNASPEKEGTGSPLLVTTFARTWGVLTCTCVRCERLGSVSAIMAAEDHCVFQGNDQANPLDQAIETFEAMKLHENLLNGINAFGLAQPSTVQQVNKRAVVMGIIQCPLTSAYL
jgi:hypothetical protein